MSAHAETVAAADVLRLGDASLEVASALLERFGLELVPVGDGEPIPGSYWGESEAGVIGHRVFARLDTPLHSLLHEACHLLVAPADKRLLIHTDASDCQREEDATCYLQVLLADELPGFGRVRAFADMDAWGYSFRLGSTRAWFEDDAEDALSALQAWGVVDAAGRVLGARRT
ncbi:MAG TPA: hypothetical protein PKZ76_09255 [Xanthomonadaceae bacterium]|nr:hypothetical protein [Xanthomonadaceae bacterium]